MGKPKSDQWQPRGPMEWVATKLPPPDSDDELTERGGWKGAGLGTGFCVGRSTMAHASQNTKSHDRDCSVQDCVEALRAGEDGEVLLSPKAQGVVPDSVLALEDPRRPRK